MQNTLALNSGLLMINLYDRSTYGRKHGFVYLRVVAMAFFFLSLYAMYYVIANIVSQANSAIMAFSDGDLASMVKAFSSFKIEGAFGVVVDLLRNLGALVIPLYFIATVTYVLNLNRGDIMKSIRVAATMAFVLAVVEYFIYTIILGVVYVLVASMMESVKEFYTGFPEGLQAAVDAAIAVLQGHFNLPFENMEEALMIAQNYISNQVSLILFRNMPTFNIFIDQLLCLLLCLFFCYTPKWAKTKGRLIFYRSLGAIPIMYIITAFTLNGLAQSGVMEPIVELLCVFPSKKLPQFIFIGCIVACNRFFPARSLRTESGMTVVYRNKKEYRASPLAFETHAAEKKRTLVSAIYLGVSLLLLCGIDLCLSFLPFAAKWGLGKSYYAVFCIPFLFFTDVRRPTRKIFYTLFSVFYALGMVAVVAIYMFV